MAAGGRAGRWVPSLGAGNAGNMLRYGVPKKRPPLHGFNHNVVYAGQAFHVQTEDFGPQRGQIITHLFSGGTILATARCSYDGDLEDSAVRQLMQSLHKTVLRQLKNGEHDAPCRAISGATL